MCEVFYKCTEQVVRLSYYGYLGYAFDNNKQQTSTTSVSSVILNSTFCPKTSLFCRVFNCLIAFLNITSTFEYFPNLNVKRSKPTLESARTASVAKDTIQRISQLNNKKRTRSVLESLSNNESQSKPVFCSKTAETSKWESRFKSQPQGLNVTKPVPSIRRPITAHVSKPTPPIPASFFDPTTSACFQEGTSESEPLDTDPKATKLLWWKVEQALRKRRKSYYRMPFDKPTRSSAAKKTTADKKVKGPVKRILFGPLSHDPPSTKTETTTVLKQLAKARAYDTQFRYLVLHARGILSNETEYRVLGEPYEYFQTSAPSGLHSAHYKTLHPNSNIWLDIGPSQASYIVDQYRLGEARYETEEVFSDLAKELLLRHDKLQDAHIAETCRITERKVKWGPAPDTKFPLPPILPSNKPAAIRPYEFRLNPDMTYYLSIKAINNEYRDEVSGFTPVVSKCAVAAYFTIEFKKDDHKEEEAKKQATAASAMWLHHRVILRQKRLAAEKTTPTPSHFQDLKHYAMTLRGPFYTFWVTVPIMTPDGKSWNGCTMRELCNAKLGSEEKATRFAQWINEIHNWGLGSWADGFLDDVKIVLRKSLGARGVVSRPRRSLGRG